MGGNVWSVSSRELFREGVPLPVKLSQAGEAAKHRPQHHLPSLPHLLPHGNQDVAGDEVWLMSPGPWEGG